MSQKHPRAAAAGFKYAVSFNFSTQEKDTSVTEAEVRFVDFLVDTIFLWLHLTMLRNSSGNCSLIRKSRKGKAVNTQRREKSSDSWSRRIVTMLHDWMMLKQKMQVVPLTVSTDHSLSLTIV